MEEYVYSYIDSYFVFYKYIHEVNTWLEWVREYIVPYVVAIIFKKTNLPHDYRMALLN